MSICLAMQEPTRQRTKTRRMLVTVKIGILRSVSLSAVCCIFWIVLKTRRLDETCNLFTVSVAKGRKLSVSLLKTDKICFWKDGKDFVASFLMKDMMKLFVEALVENPTALVTLPEEGGKAFWMLQVHLFFSSFWRQFPGVLRANSITWLMANTLWALSAGSEFSFARKSLIVFVASFSASFEPFRIDF